MRLWHLCEAAHGEAEGKETIFPANQGEVVESRREFNCRESRPAVERLKIPL